MTDLYERYSSGLHRLLLRVAGRVPDDWLWDMRRRLGGGDLFELPDYVAGGLGELGVPATVGEVALLREMTRQVHGRDPVWFSDVGDLPIDEETPATAHHFFPVLPEVIGADLERVPSRLDLTGRPGDDLWELPPALASLADVAMRLTDAEDQLMLAELGRTDGIRSVARAWRFTEPGAHADGVRVVLVEVGGDVPAWDVTWNLQGWFERLGQTAGAIETYGSGYALTPYHRSALAGSALLWTA